jgi:hypothetical protein|tara:strand:- start:1617 stop:1907 length:291 start_codon:yes stop_codon:yes gene_type:complete
MPTDSESAEWKKLISLCEQGNEDSMEKLALLTPDFAKKAADYQADLIIKKAQLYKPMEKSKDYLNGIKLIAFTTQIIGLLLLLLNDIPTPSNEKSG